MFGGGGVPPHVVRRGQCHPGCGSGPDFQVRVVGEGRAGAEGDQQGWGGVSGGQAGDVEAGCVGADHDSHADGVGEDQRVPLCARGDDAGSGCGLERGGQLGECQGLDRRAAGGGAGRCLGVVLAGASRGCAVAVAEGHGPAEPVVHGCGFSGIAVVQDTQDVAARARTVSGGHGTRG